MADSHSVLWLTDRGERHQRTAREAAPAGLTITFLRRPSRNELMAALPDVEFLISERSGEIDAGLIAAGGRLRLIQRLGSAAFDIDLEAAQAAGVPVCTWPIHMVILVAEHVLLQMLALTKRLNETQAIALAAGAWGESRRTDEDTFAYNWSGRSDVGGVYKRVVGILGLGEIGIELARRLQGLQPKEVLYHKRRPLPARFERELTLRYVSQKELLAESDILVNLLPYAAATDHLLDGAALTQMKKGALLMSCGSGSVIDEQALAEALQAGRLAGAALDTFEYEPIRPDNPLLPLARDPHANVLLTPHVAGGAGRLVPSRAKDYENIVRVLEGKPLLHRVI